jgi:hypothetical protein
LQRKRESPLDLVGPVGVARLPELAQFARTHDAVQHGLELLGAERGAVLPHQLAVMPQERRLAGAEVQVRCPGLDQHAEELLQRGPRGGVRFGQLRGAPAVATRDCRRGARRAGSPGCRSHLDERAGGARRERDRYRAARRAIREAHRLRAPEPEGGHRIGDLADQREDLHVGQRIASERARGAVGDESRGLPHGESERVRALLVQHLDQSVEPGHRQSQQFSRGGEPDARGTC